MNFDIPNVCKTRIVRIDRDTIIYITIHRDEDSIICRAEYRDVPCRIRYFDNAAALCDHYHIYDVNARGYIARLIAYLDNTL